MKIFAIGDTHLSFSRPKPMDVFGECWKDHPRRLAERWDAVVGEADVVLIVGDISWAMRLAEAAPDLRFLAERPGRLKVMIRGNHDYWWDSAKKVRAALPERMEIVQNDAWRVDEGVVFCGARGWNLPSLPYYDQERDEKLFQREVGRLETSLERARDLQRPGDAKIALLHYPPLGPDPAAPSPVMDLLGEHGVDLAVYGHLHGEEDHRWAPRGLHRGVILRFVAADFVGFEPQPVFELGRGVIPDPAVDNPLGRSQ